MKKDWDERAREDPHFYVAFGRRRQPEEEFEATAKQVVEFLIGEFRWLGDNLSALRALEIGCGPGRLMKPLASYFKEVHGVDVSEEMIRLARARLARYNNAFVYVNDGASLREFPNESFDVVYSYAVFQHIPSEEVVFGYLREARRVLRPGGLLVAQFNGLPSEAPSYDTWNGVRISCEQLAGFAQRHDFQLLRLTGARTQYMWATMRKKPEGWSKYLRQGVQTGDLLFCNVARVTNAYNSNPVIPIRGPFACASLWVEGLPLEADLNSLEVLVAGCRLKPHYISPTHRDGLQQVNVPIEASLPDGVVTGELAWFGQTISRPFLMRLVPPPPLIPRVVRLSDGIDLLSGSVITSRIGKIVVEELDAPQDLSVELESYPGTLSFETFCVDPVIPAYEVNFHVPAQVKAGCYRLRTRYRGRLIHVAEIEIKG